jgi:hypothetical protein
MTALPPPGIYFNMDEDEYRKAPALSSSGIRDLLISPLDYWSNSPSNPAYVDQKTDAMILGTAMHRRLLEPERFKAMYAAWPRPEDYPNAVDGGDALKALCGELGLKKSGKIADLCERILEANPDAQLWPVIKGDLIKRQAGRTLLKASDLEDIERAARFVFAHQSAAKALTGGYSEVSIFWIDDETGVPLKARLDNLKVKVTVDVKSFSNPLGKPIAAAVAGSVANGRYDVQAVTYDAGVEAVKRLLRERGSSVLHGAGEIPNDWLLAFAACQRHTFAFVFVETGPVTNVRVREFKEWEGHGGQGMSANAYWSAGLSGFRRGVLKYQECMKRFGPHRPWIEDEPMKPFNDMEFPMHMFNEAA